LKIRCESVDWIERNEVDSIEVAPGAYLALIQKGIEAEVERLSDFFKTKVLLEYEHLSSSGL
jgi:hypothetical protein